MFAWTKYVRYLNWMTIERTTKGVIKKRLTGLSAEMAFHAMLGLFPAIIAILTAIGLFGRSVESTLANLATNYAHIIPPQVWQLIIEFIEEVKLNQDKSWFSLSSITAIWFISGVLSAAINALDQIHEVPLKHKRSFIQVKLVAIFLTICTIIFLIMACFLLWVGDFLLQIALQQSWNSLFLITWQIFSILIIAAIFLTAFFLIYEFQTKLRRHSERKFKFTLITTIVAIGIGLMQLVYALLTFIRHSIVSLSLRQTISSLLINTWRLLGFPLALCIIALAFGLIYRFGTSSWRKDTPIVPGAILAAISWAVVSILFRLYVAHISIYNKIYGAVGTIIVLMLWLYLSSLVMLIGSQLNVVIGKAIQQEQCQIESN